MPVSIGYSVPPRRGVGARASGLLLAAIASVARALVDGAVRWAERREALRALNALDDHMLKDLGIHRSEILRAVHGAPVGRRKR